MLSSEYLVIVTSKTFVWLSMMDCVLPFAENRTELKSTLKTQVTLEVQMQRNYYIGKWLWLSW